MKIKQMGLGSYHYKLKRTISDPKGNMFVLIESRRRVRTRDKIKSNIQLLYFTAARKRSEIFSIFKNTKSTDIAYSHPYIILQMDMRLLILDVHKFQKENS